MGLTKELLERILAYLKNHKDEGDYRETWQSNQLQRDIKELEAILKEGNNILDAQGGGDG